jgi:hypothetical protein
LGMIDKHLKIAKAKVERQEGQNEALNERI